MEVPVSVSSVSSLVSAEPFNKMVSLFCCCYIQNTPNYYAPRPRDFISGIGSLILVSRSPLHVQSSKWKMEAEERSGKALRVKETRGGRDIRNQID